MNKHTKNKSPEPQVNDSDGLLKQFKCPLCEKRYKSVVSFKRHFLIHQNLPQNSNMDQTINSSIEIYSNSNNFIDDQISSIYDHEFSNNNNNQPKQEPSFLDFFNESVKSQKHHNSSGEYNFNDDENPSKLFRNNGDES